MIDKNFNIALCEAVAGDIDYSATIQMSYTSGTTSCASDYTCCCSFCGS